jgi:2'-5' RNA ligase
MLVFIGIVPPVDFYEKIAAIQKQFGDNRTEPHITLRPPIQLIDDTRWLQTIDEIISITPAFQVTLTKTDYFGNSILFIEAESERLHALEGVLVPAIAPLEKEQKKQHEKYHPHLTLGRLHVGFSREGLRKMQQLADDLLRSPYTFMVSSIRIYYKPSQHERYKVLKDVFFKQ